MLAASLRLLDAALHSKSSRMKEEDGCFLYFRRALVSMHITNLPSYKPNDMLKPKGQRDETWNTNTKLKKKHF